MTVKIYCSFCGKVSDHVEIVIAGPGSQAHICNECVDVCVEVVKEQREKNKTR